MNQDNNLGLYPNEREAATREDYKRRPHLNVQTFRVVKSYPALGYILLAITAGLLLLALAPYEACKNIMAMFAPYEISIYVFAALAGIPGIYLLLAYYVSRVSVHPEKIVHYGSAGSKEEFMWGGVTSALIHHSIGRAGVQKNIYLYSGKKKMIIDQRFKNYELLETIAKEKCPRSFPLEKIRSGGTLTIRMNTGIAISVSFIFIGIIFGILLAIPYSTLYAKLSFRAFAFCAAVPAVFTISGLNNLLLRHYSRVIINAESITCINMFGVKKQIMWSEIESVKFPDPSRLSRISPSGARLSGGGKTITISSYYLAFEGVEEIITKYCWKYYNRHHGI